ncbi:MAG: aconitate hydratase 1 [Sodalis sp. Fse]|nr:MAG: aconitate hydratase 1 [Sodalis sp. Fse]UVK79009.1 MAG: aconitate hydratase 1 [Sodalis sp. Ffu]
MSSTIKQASRDILIAHNKTYHIYSLARAAQYLGPIEKLPKSMKILLENLLRNQDDVIVTETHLRKVVGWLSNAHAEGEIVYRPVRVLMQDFTGVPAVVDLAAMREAVKRLGGNIDKVNPLLPVDLVVDHSITVDAYGNDNAYAQNNYLEMKRNMERYTFLRWGQNAFSNFRVVPPENGICHQVNLEYLAQTVWNEEQNGITVAYPDTLVGTDSHTTMVNGLGVLGWGVGGIEAEAAMLGQPVSMLIPDVVGFKLTGKLNEGITATDLVLTVTQMLRNHGVVGKFVEFYGDGLDMLPLADRATIANMAPEYGATCGFFPVDAITLDYLRLTGRKETQIALVDVYSKHQGLWRHTGDEPVFTSNLELDMATVVASLAGPKRPQDRVSLPLVPDAFKDSDELELNKCVVTPVSQLFDLDGEMYQLDHGAVVLAAITSCTNTSNANILMAAGLLARNAVKKGLRTKPWVKSSLAPGSKVVTDYLNAAGLTPYLNQLNFNLVGYGCTTCIGNSGPLKPSIEAAIKAGNLTVGAVLSGNRNFEGRIHPLIKSNWLASPPLVVAYALAGNMLINISKDPLGISRDGKPVYLKDIWPSSVEIARVVELVNSSMFHKEYREVFIGNQDWRNIEINCTPTYNWQSDSTYIRLTPFFEDMMQQPNPLKNIHGARILAMLGDSVTTDHISPAGNIKVSSPAGRYLQKHGVLVEDFNSYGSRRGNHEVMMHGTFANIHLRNEMLSTIKGGYTRHIPSGDELSIYDAAMRYAAEQVPLVIIAGKEYGSGSSRDWAAKGPRLLGIRVVIVESFERIHRSNLIGMGILPLEFSYGETRKTLGLSGDETLHILDLDRLKPGCQVPVTFSYLDGSTRTINALCRIDTCNELTYYRHDGILHYVIRSILNEPIGC